MSSLFFCVWWFALEEVHDEKSIPLFLYSVLIEGVHVLKYRGRIVLLLLSLLSSFSFWINGVDIQILLFIIFSFFHATISWIFGGWYDKYKYLSYLDPLTGAFNRRYADEVFGKRFYRAMKRNEQIGILVIDLDQFKLMNDTYGHPFGDLILKKLSQVIEKCIHKEDVLVRWGGDEFVLLLINHNKAEAELLMVQVNERLKETFSDHLEKKKNLLSLSMGFAVFPEDAKQLSELISIADKRMYDDKHEIKLKEVPCN